MYSINVQLLGRNEGTLTYKGKINVKTVCWFHPTKRIASRRYGGCSATKMTSRGYLGIYIPNVPGMSGIFIHKGTSNPVWTQGCIVIPSNTMEKIWKDITPKDAKNVTVTVVDSFTSS